MNQLPQEVILRSKQRRVIPHYEYRFERYLNISHHIYGLIPLFKMHELTLIIFRVQNVGIVENFEFTQKMKMEKK